MNVIEKLKRYKEFKAEIELIEINIEELEEEELGPAPISYDEKSGPTNRFSSATENQCISHMTKVYELESEKRTKEREIKKIDCALSILTNIEREVIRYKYLEVEDYTWFEIALKVNINERQCRRKKDEALEKMKKFL